MKLVFFDYDKTLTKIDTLIIFALYILVRTGKVLKIFPLLYLFLMFKLKYISNHRFKSYYANIVCSGIKADTISDLSYQFMDKYFGFLKKDVTIAIVEKNVRDGNNVYIISSNYDFFLYPIVRKLGINGVIGTNLEVMNGVLTGNITHLPCDGSEKLKRAIDHFGKEETKNAIMYGDSRGDAWLLQYVKDGYLVDKDRIIDWKEFVRKHEGVKNKWLKRDFNVIHVNDNYFDSSERSAMFDMLARVLGYYNMIRLKNFLLGKKSS